MASAVEKIGRHLVRQGILTDEQLESCLREHASGSVTLTQIIVSRGYTNPDRLTRALGALGPMSFKCPKGCGKVPGDPSITSCRKCGAPLESDEPAISWSSTVEAELPAEVVDASRNPKHLLGRYILIKELGRGGSGSVYKAWDSILRQFVALKLIGTGGAAFEQEHSSKEIQEFLREARTAVKLSHPHIVRVYEVGAHEGRYFLSMELIEGGSLAKLLHGKDAARRPAFYADPPKFLSILRDTARALDYAHHEKPPIVHRDVKPHNILVDPSGRACLADFGLAREIGGAGRLTLTGVAKGTPCYMAPEQAKVHGSPLDGRTDVYGLGAILYEYLSGTPPFTGASSPEILQKVLTEDAVPPSQFLRTRNIPATPPLALERIALKALEKDQNLRYASAKEFADELDRYMSGKDVAARGISPATRGVRWVARRRSIVVPVAIAVVMGIVALVAVLRKAPERVVERVVVQEKKVEGGESRLAEIQSLENGLRFAEAIQRCTELRAEIKDPAVLSRLSQMAEDLRLEREMLTGVVDRVRIQARDYDPFMVGGVRIAAAKVVDATMDRITVVGGGMRSGYPWSSVDPKQFLQLAKDYWPDISGRPALGLALWARRHHLDATTAKPATGDTDAAYFKLLSEGERSLSNGDLHIARGRFEKALEVRRDGREAQEGLDRVRAAEEKFAAPAPAAATPAPAVKPSDPKPNAATTNQKLADETYQKGQQSFETRDYRNAAANFTKSISLTMKQGNAFAMRGYSWYMLGEWTPARGDFAASVSAGSWNDQYPRLMIWVITARLGDRTAATRELRDALDKALVFANSWTEALAKYLTEDLPEFELLLLATDDSGGMKRIEKECEAYCYIGLKRIVENNPVQAKVLFQKCVQTGQKTYFEHKIALAELERLGVTDVPAADPAPLEIPRPATVKPGAMPPPPALGVGEKLLLTVPQGASWEVLSIGPGGVEAAYKENDRGRFNVVWKQSRLDDLDRVENVCLWKDGRWPVLKVGYKGKVHVTDGSDIHEAWTSATDPILSPNRQSVSFIARDGSKTCVVAHGEKGEVLEAWDTSLSYTPGNQVVYNATVPAKPDGTLSGWFVERSVYTLPGIGASARIAPAFTADTLHVAYSIGESMCVDGDYGPSFYRAHSPRFSPDGMVVAYVAEISIGGGSPPKTKKMVMVGKTPGTRYDAIAGPPMFSRDGRVISYIAKRGEKWLVVHGTRLGEEFDAIPPFIYDVEQPVMSSDGKILAYTAERAGLRVVVVNGKVLDMQPHLSAPSISADGRSVSYGYVSGQHFIWKSVIIPR